MDIVRVIEIIWCVSAFGLVAMVLLHSPKGDGIGGIGGQAQLFSSTKSAESNLNRITWGLFLVFITLTILLSVPNVLPSATVATDAVAPLAPLVPPIK